MGLDSFWRDSRIPGSLSLGLFRLAFMGELKLKAYSLYQER